MEGYRVYSVREPDKTGTVLFKSIVSPSLLRVRWDAGKEDFVNIEEVRIITGN